MLSAYQATRRASHNRQQPSAAWLNVPLAAIAAYLWVIHSQKLAIASVAVAIALVGVLFQAQRFVWPRFMVLFGLWLGWSLLTIGFAEDVGLVWEHWWEYAKLWLIVFATANAVRTPKLLFVFALVWLGLFALYPVRGTLFNMLAGISFGGGRYSWNFSFRNPNDLAAYCLIALALSTAVFFVAPKRWMRLSALSGIFVLPAVMLSTQSRGGILGLAIFGLVFLIAHQSKLRLVAVLLAVVGIAAMAAPERVWERLSGMRNLTSVETLGDADSSAEQRYVIWQVATQIIATRPLNGVGLGAYPEAHFAMVQRNPAEFGFAWGKRDTHSMYLNVLAETGAIGLLLFLVMVVTAVRPLAQLEREFRLRSGMEPMVRAAAALRAGAYGFLVCALFGTLHKEPYFFLFLLVISQFVALVRPLFFDVTASAGRLPANPHSRRSR